MTRKFMAKNIFMNGTKLTYDHDSTSHKGTKACDYSHPNSDKKYFIAPCKMTLKYFLLSSNTLVFESTEKLELADGTTDYITITFGHMEIEDCNNLYPGLRNEIYNNKTLNTSLFDKEFGEIIYKEGNYGQSNGTHCHIRIGKGKYTGVWVGDTNRDISNSIYHDEAFFVDDFSFGSGSQLSKYNFITSTSTTPTPSNNLNGIYLEAVSLPFRIRTSPVNGNQIELISVGNRAQIIEFVPGFQSDGYQWAKVIATNGEIGYSQLDLKDDYKIVCDASHSSFYMKAVNQAFRIRTSPVNGSYNNAATVTIGNRAEILSVQSNFASDGYQWAYVKNGIYTGYSQMDTWNCYQLEA